MTAQAAIAGAAQAGTLRISPAWVLLAVLAAGVVLLQGAGTLNHDAAWILTGSDRLLKGAEIGRDIVDVNPPLAWWVMAAPAAARDVLDLNLADSFLLFIALLGLASVALTGAALKAAGWDHRARELFLLVAGAVLLAAPGYHYGQREHLLLIVALPYLALLGVEVGGRSASPLLRASIGIFAAIGFCLKPHFLLIPIIAESWRVARCRSPLRSLRIETACLVLVGVVYLIAIMVWAPGYPGSVLPDALSSYWAYNQGVDAVAMKIALSCLPIAAALYLLSRGALGENIVAQALLAGFFAAVAGAMLQQKGWEYHLLPALGLGSLACAALYFGRDAGLRSSPSKVGFILMLGAAFAAPLLFFTSRLSGEETPSEQLAATFREKAGAGQSVFAFITSPRDVHPAVVEANVVWASRSCCLHLLPAAVRTDAGPASEAVRVAAQRQLDSTLTQLERDPPAVVVVDARTNMLGFKNGRFDYQAYLSRDARFRRFFGRYAEDKPVAGYRILVRR